MNSAADKQILLTRIKNRLRHEYYWHVHPLGWRLRYRAVAPPEVLLRFHSGLGDHLLCSGVFRALRERGKQHLWMMSNYPALFEHNPDVDRVVPSHPFFVRLAEKRGGVYRMLNYTTHLKAEDRDLPPSHHLIANMCSMLDLQGQVALRPYMTLAAAEQHGGRITDRQIAIQSSILAAKSPIATKEWYAERMQAVVTSLRNDYDFVQLGSPSDPPLAGARDLRGKTSLRETAAVLSQSLLFVGLVGFLMHMARAVDCRAVIIYGGRELPAQSGYSCNANLITPIVCSPCWLWNSCPYDRECMQRITADMVIAAIQQQAARVAEPLTIDYADVPSAVPELKAYL